MPPRGFFLIELLVAVVLLAVGTLAAAGTLQSVIHYHSLQRFREAAMDQTRGLLFEIETGLELPETLHEGSLPNDGKLRRNITIQHTSHEQIKFSGNIQSAQGQNLLIISGLLRNTPAEQL